VLIVSKDKNAMTNLILIAAILAVSILAHADDKLPVIDISTRTSDHVIIAQDTENVYQAL
jgi:hypothetical protein